MKTASSTRFTPFIDKENINTPTATKSQQTKAQRRAFGVNITNVQQQTPQILKAQVPTPSASTIAPKKSEKKRSKKKASTIPTPVVHLDDEIEYMPSVPSSSFRIPPELDFDLDLLVKPLRPELPCFIPVPAPQPSNDIEPDIYASVPPEFDEAEYERAMKIVSASACPSEIDCFLPETEI